MCDRVSLGRGSQRSTPCTSGGVSSAVAVMITYSTAAAQAAKAGTSTIPIVFYIGADPIKLGLVASLKRPGRNVTGVTTLSNSVEVKKLELLHELVPKASLIAMLFNPTNPNTAIDTNDVKAGFAEIRGRSHDFECQSAERSRCSI
jgi:putative tryptophan/tyrosine transport system substrate-binding protein